jgi:enoyl-CoA hydratase/carnithine racemase
VETSVRIERRDGVLWLRLDHPESRNALSLEDLHVLASALREVEEQGDRCVVITGQEPGSFSSGFRLGADAAAHMGSGSAKEAADDLFALLPSVPVPTVAIVDGPARGAGCELALRCDLRVASDRASFGIPAVRLGIPYPPEGIEFLVRRYGQGPVAWLLYAARQVDANAALAQGLVQQVVSARKLPSTVNDLLDRITASAPLVQRFLKTAVASAEGLVDRDAVSAAFAHATGSEDFAETLRAIAERREPTFTGR